MQRQENERLDSKQIDIQPHGKVRSRRARQLAEERAKARFVLKNQNQFSFRSDYISEFSNVMWLHKNV